MYLLEMMLGGGISAILLCGRTWATSSARTSEKILEKLDDLVASFNAHQLEDATALARINADLTNIYKRLDK